MRKQYVSTGLFNSDCGDVSATIKSALFACSSIFAMLQNGHYLCLAE